MNKIVHYFSIIAVLSFLSACQNGYNGPVNNPDHPDYNSKTAVKGHGHSSWWGNQKFYTDNRLAKETYRSVDRILAQTNSLAGGGTPMIVGTVANIDTLEKTHTFGRVISEQIATRLVQTGHDVAELKLRNSINIKQGHNDNAEAGEYILSRDIESLRNEYKVGRVMTGTYSVAGREIMVNLKMIDITTGKIIGANDYAVALDKNSMKLVDDGSFSFYGSSMAY